MRENQPEHATEHLKTRYIRCVLELVRKNARFFLGASLVAVVFRLFFVLWFPAVVDDSRLYADIARNWLQQGVYGITNSGHIVPTLSRLPGYPAFLAIVFAGFGIDNFRAVLIVQILFDLATCFIIADLARRCMSDRAAEAAFVLAAICPFLANYSAAALTETLEIFFTALALDFAVCALGMNRARAGINEVSVWCGTGLAVGAAILLRPDGGILLAAIGGYLLFLLYRGFRRAQDSQPVFDVRTIIRAGLILALGAALPLLPWTLRNMRTFHRFEPLAPRYANDADEPAMTGFNRWTKTWIADYVSVQEIYWNVSGDTIDVTRLPRRAFDSEQQREETATLFADYNRDKEMNPELDARFGILAAARIRSAPLRYYIWLPAARIADMWLRPRTELFPSDPRWWEFNDDHRWLAVSLVFGGVNLIYVCLGALGLLRSRSFFAVGLFVFFLLLRSAFLGTLENPEPRYTLECYPVLILLAAALFR
jgi:4-amino-4-deoxy-L-arabinose transferase-like glycosyltransferase